MRATVHAIIFMALLAVNPGCSKSGNNAEKPTDEKPTDEKPTDEKPVNKPEAAAPSERTVAALDTWKTVKGPNFSFESPVEPEHQVVRKPKGPHSYSSQQWSASMAAWHIELAWTEVPGAGPLTAEDTTAALDSSVETFGSSKVEVVNFESEWPADGRGFTGTKTSPAVAGQVRLYRINRAMLVVTAQGKGDAAAKTIARLLESIKVTAKREDDPTSWAMTVIPEAPFTFDSPGYTSVKNRRKSDRISYQYIVSDNHGVDYVVLVDALLRPVDAATSKARAQELLQRAATIAGVENPTTTPFTLGDLTGVQAQMDGQSKKGAVTVWARIVVGPETETLVLVNGQTSVFNTARAEHFLASMKAKKAVRPTFDEAASPPPPPPAEAPNSAKCAALSAELKTTTDDAAVADKLSSAILSCSAACDGKHTPSCDVLKSHMKLLCGAAKEACATLCAGTGSPSLKANACANSTP